MVATSKPSPDGAANHEQECGFDEYILPRLVQCSCSFKPLLLTSMLHLTALLSAASARELIFAVDSRRNAAAVAALELCGKPLSNLPSSARLLRIELQPRPGTCGAAPCLVMGT